MQKNKKILVTGGAGYIGSHTVVLLVEAGYDVIIYDNFSNSSKESINRAEKIVGKELTVIEGDTLDREKLSLVFETHHITSVIHFAGYKAVGESVSNPLKYYENNIQGTIILCSVMAKYGCKSIIFSSSATVYGESAVSPISEDAVLMPTNPYGRSKLMTEGILRDLYRSDAAWNIVILRYFNPVGAHASGMIGEDPRGIPNNLMPFIAQVAVGKCEHLNIFGDDYNTHDGTGVRDYIHVMDLAEGHAKALDIINDLDELLAINLGTGMGYSVLDIVKEFEHISGKKIPYYIVPRRAGDIAQCYANTDYAFDMLKWKSKRKIKEMCADSWRWQENNPTGYIG